MSWLSVLGKDVKKVFGWLGSPKSQAIVGVAETVVEDVAPELTGLINLTNTWMREIFQAQALAEAASASATGGLQKATIVLATLTPQILGFAKAQGLPTPSEQDMVLANNALVAFYNALGAGTAATSPLAVAQTQTPLPPPMPVVQASLISQL